MHLKPTSPSASAPRTVGLFCIAVLLLRGQSVREPVPNDVPVGAVPSSQGLRAVPGGDQPSGAGSPLLPRYLAW